MRKDTTLLEQRRAYIQQRISEAKKVEVEVKKLSRELFLSERTIMNDVKKQL